MFRDHIPQINQDILRTKRAIISIGCSFVQGQGAVNQHIYDNYNWQTPEFGHAHINWNLSKEEKLKLVNEFPDITIDPFNGNIEFKTHEYNNSFVTVLAKKYFQGDYAAINLGRSGNGNRASIKELYFYPDILWNEIKECIVVYCPSGQERFDFITDVYHTPNDHGRWEAMWPNEMPNPGSRQKLWEGYKTHLYSEKFEVMEQIVHMQELLLWCKYKNAKLIIVPGFSVCYKKDHFAKQINRKIVRNHNGDMITNELVKPISKESEQVASMWPWDNMYSPDGCDTFVDLLMKQEFPDSWRDTAFYRFIGKGTPDKWITPCCHPSVKGHDLFASYLYQELCSNPTKYELNKRIGNL